VVVSKSAFGSAAHASKGRYFGTDLSAGNQHIDETNASRIGGRFDLKGRLLGGGCDR
jgi:hypothetical protein